MAATLGEAARDSAREARISEADAHPTTDTTTVAVLAPFGKDCELATSILDNWGFSATACDDMDALCASLTHGTGALVLAEEALTPDTSAKLLEALRSQPTWSDVPIIVLTMAGERAIGRSRALQELSEAGNLTIMERPVRLAAFITTVRSAIRARRRQYEVRDYLAERTERELELSEARRQAEAASAVKSRFLATMSHELRTPLNAIAGYADILALEVHGRITKQQRGDVERIQRSQRYLLSLINDILNYAKIEAGHVSFNIEPFALDALVRRVEGFVSPQLGAKQISYTCKLPNKPLMARADEDKTQQIVINLLSNALKFTPEGGKIEVRCAQSGDEVVVTVSDSGPGIAEDKLEMIFEPFVQVGRSLTSSNEGTGLGLSISRDLARKMNGDLTVESTVGAGSKFTLRLPRG